MVYSNSQKTEVKKFRLAGHSYAEIDAIFGIPKSTLAGWFRGMELPAETRQKLQAKSQSNLIKARERALKVKKVARVAYLDSFIQKNKAYRRLIDDPVVAKVALAMLYAGEGAKSYRMSSIKFANSDPLLIKLFLKLFKTCYDIEPTKLRCGVQCRADQDTGQLEHFWYTVTGIPFNQFLKVKIDPRTVGKPTLKPDYKGVCVIQYSFAPIFFDLMKTIEVITGP